MPASHREAVTVNFTDEVLYYLMRWKSTFRRYACVAGHGTLDFRTEVCEVRQEDAPPGKIGGGHVHTLQIDGSNILAKRLLGARTKVFIPPVNTARTATTRKSSTSCERYFIHARSHINPPFPLCPSRIYRRQPTPYRQRHLR